MRHPRHDKLVFIRPSGTEKLIRVMVESASPRIAPLPMKNAAST